MCLFDKCNCTTLLYLQFSLHLLSECTTSCLTATSFFIIFFTLYLLYQTTLLRLSTSNKDKPEQKFKNFESKIFVVVLENNQIVSVIAIHHDVTFEILEQ